MKTLLQIVVGLCGLFALQAEAQIYDTNDVVVQTFAGSGFYGYLDGVGQQTMFHNPSAIVADSSNNLFVLDADNGRIRKITPDGTVSTFVGGGTGKLPGTGTNVQFAVGSGPMAIDHSNVIWIGNLGSLVRIGTDAEVSTVSLGWGVNDGPNGICFDSANNMYLSSESQDKIYRLGTNDVPEVFVGSGNPGSVDGNGIFCSFYNPTALAIDAADYIYVSDLDGMLIRRINQNRDVVTIAGHPDWLGTVASDGVGTNADFPVGLVAGMCMDSSGNLILACGSVVRRMDSTTSVTTIAGSFNQSGYTNGPGFLARFIAANGVCVSPGMIFVADAANERIRSISFNSTLQPVSPVNLQLSTYPGLQITGTVGRTYQIQSSPDMKQWNTVATLLLTSSPYLWIDQNPVSGSKFYRAFLLP
jgi:sugar lactone lactonase YvrE